MEIRRHPMLQYPALCETSANRCSCSSRWQGWGLGATLKCRLRRPCVWHILLPCEALKISRRKSKNFHLSKSNALPNGWRNIGRVSGIAGSLKMQGRAALYAALSTRPSPTSKPAKPVACRDQPRERDLLGSLSRPRAANSNSRPQTVSALAQRSLSPLPSFQESRRRHVVRTDRQKPPQAGETLIWFWIGNHAGYQRLIRS